MGNDRETTQVIMSLQRATMFMDPFFKLTMMGTAFLITYLARMTKEKKISMGEFRDVQDFVKTTDGNYTIVNIPFDKNYSPWQVKEIVLEDKKGYIVQNIITGEKICDKKGKTAVWKGMKKAEQRMNLQNQKENLVLDELKGMGIRHVVLPDLDKDDGMVQIALFNEDREKFTGWQERYLLSRMQGGEQEFRDLQNLTNGNTSLLSVPVEGEEIDKMKQDFGKLKINYAILPDLNVGDGEIQIVVANSDVPNVEFWHQMYNQDLLDQGKEPKEMKSVTMEAYARTGEMTEEQYIDTSSEELKQANAKYEGREQGELEKTVKNEEKGIRSMNHEAYDKYSKDPDYVQISVDKETLVDNSKYGRSSEIREKGLFACRIPGTYGESEQTLAISTDRVFSYNGGRQFYIFMKRSEKPVVLSPTGEKIPEERRKTGEELRKSYFDPVEHQRKAGKQISKGKDFNNFQRRDYNFDDLEQALLRR